MDPPTWKHDEDLGFDGAKSQLNLLAVALKTVIDAEKRKLDQMLRTRNLYKK